MRRPEESTPTASTAPPERWTPPAPQSAAEAPEGDAAAGATGKVGNFLLHIEFFALQQRVDDFS